jgi:hypothetical protein
MSEKIFALGITIGILLAMALWVPCLEMFRKAFKKRQALQSYNHVNPAAFVRTKQNS